jgi:hypothetical protein
MDKYSFNGIYNDILPNNMPLRLRDPNLTATKNNTAFLYIFCLMLRIVLGIFIYCGKISNNAIYILSLFVIISFSIKFIRYEQTWKNYTRTIIIYALVSIFTTYHNKTSQRTLNGNIGGIMIIIDALMGQQSRFIQTNML